MANINIPYRDNVPKQKQTFNEYFRWRKNTLRNVENCSNQHTTYNEDGEMANLDLHAANLEADFKFINEVIRCCDHKKDLLRFNYKKIRGNI